MLLQHPLSIGMSSQHPNLKESPPGQHLPPPPHLQQDHHQQHDDDELYQKLPFPYKLHQLLDDAVQEGKEHIISWLPSGTAFKVHRPLLFTSEIMSNYFRQTQYKSFTRQVRSNVVCSESVCFELCCSAFVGLSKRSLVFTPLQ